jgi:hypothetical protein
VNPGVGTYLSTSPATTASINLPVASLTDILTLDLGPGVWFVTASVPVSANNVAMVTWRLWDHGSNTIGAAISLIQATGRLQTTVCGFAVNLPQVWIAIQPGAANCAVNPGSSGAGLIDVQMTAFRIA